MTISKPKMPNKWFAMTILISSFSTPGKSDLSCRARRGGSPRITPRPTLTDRDIFSFSTPWANGISLFSN